MRDAAGSGDRAHARLDRGVGEAGRRSAELRDVELGGAELELDDAALFGRLEAGERQGRGKSEDERGRRG